MASKRFENDQHAGAIFKHLYSAWKEGRYIDIILHIGNTKIAAHKLVLSGLSDYFKTLFDRDAKDSNDVDLKDVDVDVDAFKALLKYAYTGCIEIHSQNVQELLIASDYFQITYVKTGCEEYLLCQIQKETWRPLLTLSDTFSLQKLKKTCFDYLGEHFGDICSTDTFLCTPVDILLQFLRRNYIVILRHTLPIQADEVELSLFRAVLRYGSENELCNEDMENLLKSIRYPAIAEENRDAELRKWPKIGRHSAMEYIIQLLKKKGSAETSDAWIKRETAVPQLIAYFSHCANSGHLKRYHGCRPVTVFDDSKHLNNRYVDIVQLKLWIRSWDDRPVLGGYVVKYSNGCSIQHGKAAGNKHVSEHVIDLEEGEFITQIKGRHGWLVDQLHFTTSREREFGPFGGYGGSKFKCEHAIKKVPLFLYAFSGELVKTQGYSAIIDLGFIWKYFDKSDQSVNQ